jgi:hypothetical protein
MCEERYRLVNEYVAAARSLARAAAHLRRLHGEELTQARIDSDAARTKCNETREALLGHETNHAGCAGPLRRRAEAHAAHG